MANIGELNSLRITRKADFGFYLDADTRDTNDDILLPNNSTEGKKLDIGDTVEAYVYRDTKDRIIATLKRPLALVGDLAYLKVVDKTTIGAFVDIGLERDVLIPFKEQIDELDVGESYLVYLYLDKTDRIAGTTQIERYLEFTDKYEIGDEVTGVVYGFQTNESAMIAVESTLKGVILKNEYFTDIKIGDTLSLRVKKYYEDSRIGLTPRQGRLYERDSIEEKIMEYLTSNDGFMTLNDKSSPEDIKKFFGSSKNYFKIALGGLMKKNLITQDSTGTKLK